MNFLQNIGNSIVSGFKSAVAPLLRQGYFTDRPNNAPTTASLLSNINSLASPKSTTQKDTGLMTTGLNANNYQPGTPYTAPGGTQIGQVNPNASGVDVSGIRPIVNAIPTNPDLFNQFQLDNQGQVAFKPQPAPGGSQPREQFLQGEAARQSQAQGKAGEAGQTNLMWNPGGGTSVGGGNPAFGLGGVSGIGGTARGANFGGGVGGPSLTTLAGTEEEKDKQTKKQTNFKMIDVTTAQNAARAGQLFGTGQSGVFKDAQGNFYGIGNAQVANIFGQGVDAAGKPITTITPTTQTPTLAPFQASINTQPIDAEALLKGVPDKLLPTYQEKFNDLNTQIQENLKNQPPLPAQFAVETQAQSEFRNNLPVNEQEYYDQLYTQIGLPQKSAELVAKKRELAATEEGLQKIIKDMQDNPDMPKGLAARMIKDFTDKNAINLNRLKAEIDTLIDEKNELDKRFDAKLGIHEKAVTRRETQQQQARDDAQQNLNNIWTQIANGTFDPELLQSPEFGPQVAQLEKAAGFAEGTTAQLSSKAKQYDSIITKENAQGDVSIIGVKGDTVNVIKTIKGVGTPTKPTESVQTEARLTSPNSAINQMQAHLRTTNPNWDGWLNPWFYKDLLNEYAKQNPGKAQEFLNAFPLEVYINPTDRYIFAK